MISEKKRKKQELIRQLNEGFSKVKEAKTADEYYKWQDKVDEVAFKLKELEFRDWH